MPIQLLFFQGCPYLDGARQALRAALAAEQCDDVIEEVDVDAAAWARGWGSPTILIDGEDVFGEAPAGAPACRRYPGGAPSVEVLRAALARRGAAHADPDAS